MFQNEWQKLKIFCQLLWKNDEGTAPTNPFYTYGTRTTLSNTGSIVSEQMQVYDSENVVSIWSKDLLYESEELQQLAFLEGGETSPVFKKSGLATQQGVIEYFSLLKRLTGNPVQGDRVSYGMEDKFEDEAESVSLRLWRITGITGRAENKAPTWNYPEQTRIAITRRVAELKDEHKYKAAIGVSSFDREDTPGAIFTGEPPTRIVYPEGTSNLGEITASHVFNVKQAARAVEKLQTGYTGSGVSTDSWVCHPPTIGGKEVNAVIMLDPFCKFDLRWENERRLEGWYKDAWEMGKGNPIWEGMGDKFYIDGILYFVPRFPLDRLMRYTTAPWSTGIDTTTPGTQVALNVVMGAQALCRAIAMEDLLEFEWYDGHQFQRTIGGSWEGLTKTRFGRGASGANAQDYACVVMPCAANAH